MILAVFLPTCRRKVARTGPSYFISLLHELSLRCCVDIPRELDFLADCLVMSVQGCMHAQQQIEINEVKKGGYGGWEPVGSPFSNLKYTSLI